MTERYPRRMKTCQVRGCESEAETPVHLSELPGRETGGPVIQGFVCRFHEGALVAGAPFLTDRDEHEIFMGEDVPPVLSNITLHGELGNPTMTIELSRDGVVVQEVEVLISDEFERAMFEKDPDTDHWIQEMRRNAVEKD